MSFDHLTERYYEASRAYYEAPRAYGRRAGDPPAVFLAGGITGVPDWQTYAATTLLDAGLIVLNPRRSDFPIDDPQAARQQVFWEQDHLHLPGVVTLFWFPACDPQVTVQPIALLELGQALVDRRREIYVGADPNYPRKIDVRLQTEYHRPSVAIASELTVLVRDLLSNVGR